MSKINIKDGLIGKIVKMMTAEFNEKKDENGEVIPGSKNKTIDTGKTFEVSLSESKGGKWREFKDLFERIYKKYESDMDFAPPAMHKWDPNGGTSAKFFYAGDPYLLFVDIEGKNYDNYCISITKSSYSVKGKEKYEEYLKDK